jgi:hypothetical protein
LVGECEFITISRSWDYYGHFGDPVPGLGREHNDLELEAGLHLQDKEDHEVVLLAAADAIAAETR